MLTVGRIKYWFSKASTMVHCKLCRAHVGIWQIDCVCVRFYVFLFCLSLSLSLVLPWYVFVFQLWLFVCLSVAHMIFTAVEAVDFVNKKIWYCRRAQLLYVCITYEELHSHKNVLAVVLYGEYTWIRCHIQLNIKAKQFYFEAIIVFTYTCTLHTHEKKTHQQQQQRNNTKIWAR